MLCLNPNCNHTNSLKKAQQRRTVLYTLDRGPVPSWSIHLYCRGEFIRCDIQVIESNHAILRLIECHTNYHNNFYVRSGMRFYYDSIPTVVQMSEHHFVETRVVWIWEMDMNVAWYANIVIDRYNVPTIYSSPQEVCNELCKDIHVVTFGE